MTLSVPFLAVLVLLQSVVGAIFVVLLFSLLRCVRQSGHLSRFRSREPAMTDLLNWAALVEDGIVVGKDGSLMAGFLFETQEDSKTAHLLHKEALSFHLNKAFSALSSGWMVHMDAVRRSAVRYPHPREKNAFPDPVCAAIDEERRAFFEKSGRLYESFFVLTVTWMPPVVAQRRFVEMMFDDDEKRGKKNDATQELLGLFRQGIKTLENHLSVSLRLTRLRSHKVGAENGKDIVFDDFLSWLRFCATGIQSPVRLPDVPAYLDSFLGAREIHSGVIPQIGRSFVQIVAIDGFPLHSYPGVLASLAEMPCSYRWSTRFICMDRHEAVQVLDKFRKKWRQKMRGFFDQIFNTSTSAIDTDALAMMEDAQASMAEINSGAVGAGYYTSVIIFMHEDRKELEKLAMAAERSIASLGFSARVETINTMDAFMGSLPGNGVANVRRPLLSTMNLADLLPVSSPFRGHDRCPCPLYPPFSPPLMSCVSRGGTPFRLNLHVHDLGHSFLFGPTGSGKSVHLAMLAAQMRRYKDMSLYVFDKGLSMYALTKAAGGHHYSCGADNKGLSFCPLGFLETPSDLAWAVEWVEGILTLNGVEVTPLRRNAITESLQSMQSSGSCTLSEFSLTTQDKTIREALRPYTVDGAMGHLMDAREDGLALSSFNTFEIEDLMNLGEKFALPVLLYLFRRIERSLNGRPSAILLDEAWIMLAHPVFRDKIREWLKVLRKANCLVVMATQSLSDAANSGILDVIAESTATKIFLPNMQAAEEAAPLYARLGLNEQQIGMIATAIPKRDYYSVTREGSALYSLHLGPLALAFAGASDKESVAAIREIEKTHGKEWVKVWMQRHHLDPALLTRTFS